MDWNFQLDVTRKGDRPSPSSRGRGLKYDLCDTQAQEHTSPSSRGRGLKFDRELVVLYRCTVALFTRAWIEISIHRLWEDKHQVALFTRAWIEIKLQHSTNVSKSVALFTRIEITLSIYASSVSIVALFARAWIEIRQGTSHGKNPAVALFTRAWIEISYRQDRRIKRHSRPLCEGVDWNFLPCPMRLSPQFYSKARLEVDDILFHNP